MPTPDLAPDWGGPVACPSGPVASRPTYEDIVRGEFVGLNACMYFRPVLSFLAYSYSKFVEKRWPKAP